MTVGDGVTFTATATGMPRPEARWELSSDGGRSWQTDLEHASSLPVGTNGLRATLTATTTVPADNGIRIRAVFTTLAGDVATSQAILTVLAKPVVVAPPRKFSVSSGGHVDFYVVLNSALPVAIRWQVSVDAGRTWKALSNQTGTHLLFIAAPSMNRWRYRAVLRNDLGSAVTESAILTVVSPFGTALPSNPTGAGPSTGAGTRPPRATLPKTGTDLTAPLRLAAALLTAGTALLVFGRRRRSRLPE